ncbi:MAG: amidohydrolase [Gemmatimonadaceae bacterium]
MRPHLTVLAALVAAATIPAPLAAQQAPAGLQREIDRRAATVMPRVVEWRRDFHQHPELSNRETRTSGIVAAHLEKLGIRVRRIAGTGVVGVLTGGKPGPVVALRADMDALPVAEQVDLPFKSIVRSSYNGQDVGVMHACGHDMHTAILMGVAEVLAGMRAQVPGTVVFLFQPAEEGVPTGETGGAPQMIAEGALDDPKVSAIFGLHVFAGYRTNDVVLRPAGLMASSDTWGMTLLGRQTHGGMPWGGVDPIVAASQVISGFQTIVSRQADLTTSPVVVTVGTIHGGVRFNIVPDSVVMTGTVRVFDPGMRDTIKVRMNRMAQGIAGASGATASLRFEGAGNPVTFNDPALTEKIRPTVERVAGRERTIPGQVTTTAEDYAWYQQKVPGVYLFLGVTPPGEDLKAVARNHSPKFFADEAALPMGVRLLANLAIDYLTLTK